MDEREERERAWAETREATRRASEPVLADLAAAGFRLEAISDLFNTDCDYRPAIPLLLEWVPRVSHPWTKELIIRALSVPAAKPVAAPLLIDEFRRAPPHEVSGLKWAIGNALSVVADDSVFEHLAALVTDKGHGKAREMLAIALGNMKDPRAVDLLIRLLGDEGVAGHAVVALGKLRAIRARPLVARFLEHPKSWIRRAAKQALAKIDKAASRQEAGRGGPASEPATRREAGENPTARRNSGLP
jgi:hypothetical protein